MVRVVICNHSVELLIEVQRCFKLVHQRKYPSTVDFKGFDFGIIVIAPDHLQHVSVQTHFFQVCSYFGLQIETLKSGFVLRVFFCKEFIHANITDSEVVVLVVWYGKPVFYQ